MFNHLFAKVAMLALSLAAVPVFAQPAGPGGIQGPSNDDFVITNGDLVVRDNRPAVRTRLDSATGDWFGFDPNGRRVILMDQSGANVFLGGNGTGSDGDIVLFSDGVSDQATGNASIHLDAGAGVIRLGGGTERGQMVLRNAAGDQHILLDGGDASAFIGNTGHRGRLEVRDANGTATAAIDGAAGRIRANQVISRHSGQGGAEGIDSASVYVESRNPAIALLDTTSGNTQGWYVQAGSTGRLVFSAGDTGGLANRVLVLEPDGGVCLGSCN